MGLTLWRNTRIAPMSDAGDWGLIEHGALLLEEDRIRWIGDDRELAPGLPIHTEHDLSGMLVTPGLIDAHTHLIYGGNRAGEFEQRLQGTSYEQIAHAGGGIRSTVAATRAASDEALFAAARERLAVLRAEGVTTIEIKSGYGLSLEHERRCLQTARRLQRDLKVHVCATYLAAHAVPAEFDGRDDDYIDAVCQWIPRLHDERLIDAVDAFCDRIGFTPTQTARVFDQARKLGLPVKLHAEQLSDQGGAALAASYGALSCDHLEYLNDEGVAAMAGAGTVAMLLPGAFYFLRETRVPPLAALRRAGVPIAIASDHNPGSCPALSLRLMLNFACTLFGMTPQEALAAVTKNAARALGLADRGQLSAGLRADFAVWDLEHPSELAYWIGGNPCRRVICGGVEMPSEAPSRS
jgi:imidazolonepropionase